MYRKGGIFMYQELQARIVTREEIDEYAIFLHDQERSNTTIQKYIHDLQRAAEYFAGIELSKAILIDWKNRLTEKYAAASVNTVLASLNGFLKFMGWNDLTVKPLKLQKNMFCDENRELTQEEYQRLVHAAESTGHQRLSLIIQTICATGIRVSELRFITVEAIHVGHVEVSNKGKRRTVFLANQLRQLLSRYIEKQKITTGTVFVSRSGKPLDRSNIWRDMKKLCKSAGVEASKVFPHNLRHLFARTYYSIEKDISRLADILGHSNVNTTRIYTMESGVIHAQQLERLGLIIT